MPCENYREALIDAAAAKSEPTRELRSHLDACGSCRAAFAEEQQLFAAIDTGLRVAANAEVPASLLPRVRDQLIERPASSHSWIPAFAGVGIAAALVVALVLARNPARDGAEQNPQAISTAHNVLPTVNQPAIPGGAPLETGHTARKHARVWAVKTAPAGHAASLEAEVLIPAGQKHAIDVLLNRMQEGDLQADVLPADRPEKPLRTLEVSPLEISPIEIKPLPEVSMQTVSPEDKTKR
jgi:anti-sigma factor RsiW